MAITLDGTSGITSPDVTSDGLTVDSTTLVVDEANNRVGIGTSSPGSTLNLEAATCTIRLKDTGASDYALIGTDDDGSLSLYARTAAGVVDFRTNNTERMRIDSSGNLLVGTTTASNKFVVSGNTGGTAVAQIINSTSSGNVISLASTLQSNGNNTSSAHFQGNTNSVGNWYLFGNGTTSYSSDQRLKKNIETTRDGYLEDLCQLRVVKYNWKNDEEGKPKELGLIAQEVEQVFPSLVQDDLNFISQDDPTLYKQLKQSVLPFMLLKAIQELSAKNDALEARISALEGAQA